MRWRALLSSCHPFTAGHKNKPHGMYGLQVQAEFSWDSEMKVVICTVAKRLLENNDLADGGLNKWEIEWSNAKTSLWEEVSSSSGYFDHGVVSVWESWWHEWVGGEETYWQTVNLFSRQMMSISNRTGAVSQSWWSLASMVSHSCWYRQCSACRRQ